MNENETIQMIRINWDQVTHVMRDEVGQTSGGKWLNKWVTRLRICFVGGGVLAIEGEAAERVWAQTAELWRNPVEVITVPTDRV